MSGNVDEEGNLKFINSIPWEQLELSYLNNFWLTPFWIDVLICYIKLDPYLYYNITKLIDW